MIHAPGRPEFRRRAAARMGCRAPAGEVFTSVLALVSAMFSPGWFYGARGRRIKDFVAAGKMRYFIQLSGSADRRLRLEGGHGPKIAERSTVRPGRGIW